jgi:acyl-CoA thioester hydrolase
MGHLNVRFYVARCMEALVGLAAEMGMPQAFSPAALSTLVVREQHVRFLREARPAALLRITGGVLEMGEADARLLLLMHHEDGGLAASFQTVVGHVTARELRPFPWPERVRARAGALGVALPPKAEARSLSLAPAQVTASLERARQLGLSPIAQGAILPQDCDAFGRMRADGFMGRVSDGIARLSFADEADGPTIGGAALEYRLIHLAWPRAGDRVALCSGLAAVEPRTRRIVHWLLDPQTGAPWGVAEATAASFDLEARKLVELAPDALERLRRHVVPGLTL